MIEINLLPGSGKKNRSTGFSLSDIQSLLDIAYADDTPCDDVLALAQNRLADVRAYLLTPVRVFIEKQADSVRISWVALLPGFILESSTNPSDPNSWGTVPDLPILDGPLKVVTLTASATAKYFRLREQ